jgi:hypothetical protein
MASLTETGLSGTSRDTGSNTAARRGRKQKNCTVCLAKFTPRSSLQKTCFDVRCAIEHGKRQAAKKAKREKVQDRRETRAALVKLRTVRDWTKLAQAEFNRYIKLRDAFLPCVSCGMTEHKTGYHKIDGWVASHYRSVGACPELRYHEDNVHKACVECNSHLSGNIVEYRIGLLARIGAERLAFLEGPHELKRYRIEELIAIRDTYRAKCKHLKFLRDSRASFA